VREINRNYFSIALAATCLSITVLATPVEASDKPTSDAGELDPISRDSSGSRQAQALVSAGCDEFTMPRNDDGSSTRVSLPFPINFFGNPYDSLYVNNNGNVTFDAPLSTYVPFDLSATNRVIIAPFFADVDTRPLNGGTVTFGTTSFNGQTAFCVKWKEVGYFSRRTDKTNSFQLLLVQQSTVGDFDILFSYDQVQWELGSASNNVAARVGFSNGDITKSVQLAGSAVGGAFLDGGPRSLVSGSLNGGGLGTYRFEVRAGGTRNDPRNVPPGFSADSNWWDWTDDDKDGLPDY
jgi:hypothetical protein